MSRDLGLIALVWLEPRGSVRACLDLSGDRAEAGRGADERLPPVEQAPDTRAENNKSHKNDQGSGCVRRSSIVFSGDGIADGV